MKLEPAIVRSCTPAGCIVQLRDGRLVEAVYSPAVRDRVRIRQRQLVALAEQDGAPVIAWRWFRGVVEALGDDGPAVRRDDLPPGACRVLTRAHGHPVEPGQAVFYTHRDEWELAAPAEGEWPRDPLAVIERCREAIEASLS